MTPLLEARDLRKHFGGGLLDRTHTVALRDFSLALDGDRPSVTAIVGESGSGKTTLARLLLGILAPTAGAGAVPGPGPPRHVAAGSVERSGARCRRSSRTRTRSTTRSTASTTCWRCPSPSSGWPRRARRRQTLIEDALRAVGLRPEETLGRFPHQLSGGQRQRVMVARALLLRPRVILADEPVSMVDASLRATILGALRQMTLDLGISVIYITHDLATAYQVAENIVVLYRGAVVEAGDVERVVKHPQHPYTQLLIASIPLPGVERTWGSGSRTAPGGSAPG